MALTRGEATEKDLLGLSGHPSYLLDVLLLPAEQIGADQILQNHGTTVRELDLHGARVREASDFDGVGELDFKSRERAEPAGVHEVEEAPELTEVVLDWSAREEEAVDGPQALAHEGHLGVGVTNLRRFIFRCFFVS